MLFGKVR